MKVEWINSWQEIYSEDFQNHWRKLLEKSENSHVFFTVELVLAWLNTYRPIRIFEPRFLLIESENGSLLWPMVIWRRNWKNAFCRFLIAVGYSDFDYAEPIVYGDRKFLMQEALKQIYGRSDYDQIEIGGLGEFENLKKEEQFCPICNLAGFSDGEEFLCNAKKSLREDIRRQFNRAREQGNLRFESCSREEAQRELADFLEAHKTRWPHAYKAPHFHENLLNSGIPSGIVCFDRLTLNETTIAWHLGYHYRRRFYYYMPANRVEFQKLSPGKLLLYKLVERSIFEQDTVFDHLRGDENYKSGWTNQIQPLWKISARKMTAVSFCKFFFLDKIRPHFL